MDSLPDLTERGKRLRKEYDENLKLATEKFYLELVEDIPDFLHYFDRAVIANNSNIITFNMPLHGEALCQSSKMKQYNPRNIPFIYYNGKSTFAFKFESEKCDVTGHYVCVTVNI